MKNANIKFNSFSLIVVIFILNVFWKYWQLDINVQSNRDFTQLSRSQDIKCVKCVCCCELQNTSAHNMLVVSVGFHFTRDSICTVKTLSTCRQTVSFPPHSTTNLSYFLNASFPFLKKSLWLWMMLFVLAGNRNFKRSVIYKWGHALFTLNHIMFSFGSNLCNQN